jgi:hypothetical protein
MVYWRYRTKKELACGQPFFPPLPEGSGLQKGILMKGSYRLSSSDILRRVDIGVGFLPTTKTKELGLTATIPFIDIATRDAEVL